MITIRKSEERGHANHGWLDAYHTFSFADYYDPEFTGFSHLLVLNQDRVQPGKGFGTHGHKDMEIVTYVLDGVLEHKDSMGNGSQMRHGEVQYMAAGSGVTPVMSILKTALAAGNGPIVFFYANRGENDVIFAAELRELTHAHDDRLTVIHWLESLSGLPTVPTLARIFSPFAGHHAYLCGPGPFMDAVHKGLATAGFAHHDVHSEVYSSLSGDPFADIAHEAPTAEEEADAATVDIELDGETHTLSWPRGRNLVDVMLAAGLDAPYSCLEGECGSCACTLTEGTVEMGNPGALDEDDIADGYILGCQSTPTSDRLRVEF